MIWKIIIGLMFNREKHFKDQKK